MLIKLLLEENNFSKQNSKLVVQHVAGASNHM